MKKVKNISKHKYVAFDKGGRRVEFLPGETHEMVHPPREGYPYEIASSEKKEIVEETKTKRRNI